MNRRSFLSLCALTVSATAMTYYWPNRWKYIVIHHSAGAYGTIDFLQKVHRERQPHDPIDAIPYHYIIGNGNGMALGEIASDWRQKWNMWGAHLTTRNIDRNFRGIGICLIGNFDKRNVPERQYQALIKLTRRLMKSHNISPENVTVHGKTPGENTRCPGKNFPLKRLRQDIS